MCIYMGRYYTCTVVCVCVCSVRTVYVWFMLYSVYKCDCAVIFWGGLCVYEILLCVCVCVSCVMYRVCVRVRCPYVCDDVWLCM